jgi:hypothetical protein
MESQTAILRSKYEENAKPFLLRIPASADLPNTRSRLVFPKAFVIDHL